MTFSDFNKPVIEYVTDPRTGIASEIKWVPNIAEIRIACVKAATRMVELAKPSIKFERKAYAPPVKMPSGTSYFEMFAKHGRPVGFFENPDDQWNHGRKVMPQAEAELKKSDLVAINKKIFERECNAAGVDPAKGVSPSLLNILNAG